MNGLAKFGAGVAVFLCVFALTWFAYFPHSPLGRQEANLRLAERHGPIVKERLRRTSGVTNLIVGSFTGADGLLSVSAEVADEESANSVISEVLSMAPPVGVQFMQLIGGTSVIRKIIEPSGSANRSKRIRSETNQPLSAAGSRRCP